MPAKGSPMEMGDISGDDGSSVRRIPKKYVVSASGVIAGGENDYNEFSYSALCDITTLKETLQKEFRGRAIPGQPTHGQRKTDEGIHVFLGHSPGRRHEPCK